MKKKLKLAFVAPDILSDYHKQQLAILEKLVDNYPISFSVVTPFQLFFSDPVSKHGCFPLFKLAKNMSFDGYILSSSPMIDILGEQICLDIIDTLLEKPLVSLSYLSEKCCSIMIDNHMGMTELVRHFIYHHRYTKIGFIRGASWHKEAEERYHAFLDSMNEANLPINEDWIFNGNFQSTQARNLVGDYLKTNPMLPEALIAVNDNSAIGAMKALKENNLQHSIAIGGFDNIPFSAELDLTTVDQSACQQFEKAVDVLLKIHQGKQVESAYSVQPFTVIRQSCGCPASAQFQIHEDPTEIQDDQTGGYNLGVVSEFARSNVEVRDVFELRESILDLLMSFRVGSASLYLFEEGTPAVGDKPRVFQEGGNLLLDYKEDALVRSPSKSYSLIRHFEEQFSSKTSIQVLTNLQFQNEYYGHLIVELGHKEAPLILKVKQEIETALHNLYMQRKLSKTFNELEKSLKENQGLLNLLAHDIKNPLCHIFYSIDILKRNTQTTAELEKYFSIAEKSVTNCSHIIDDVLSLQKFKTKDVSITKTRILLKDFIDEIRQEFSQSAKDKNIKLSYNINLQQNYFNSSIEMLRSIFRNLISNALKFSPKGSEVTVAFRLDKRTLTFSVADKGPGFSDEDRRKLYTPFEPLSARPTGSESSTGLGLSLIKTLTDRLDGKIHLETKSGKGSRFKVVIPEIIVNND